ncbi:hypothetical protein CLAIMM_06891 isoform 4 [Cladophialophora immunda]|nr:hypothetical protein CLAIMM_06891 isoform 1 [Cladophialophora immunda]OQV01554.1 hypothetical protein CLAIMM_06891 isoform 3 [Cladophialophora immunda]OQV01555.1 hypothetical protein CLAIMM_06891 isoform 4 [Cladophialophora immunda]
MRPLTLDSELVPGEPAKLSLGADSLLLLSTLRRSLVAYWPTGLLITPPGRLSAGPSAKHINAPHDPPESPVGHRKLPHPSSTRTVSGLDEAVKSLGRLHKSWDDVAISSSPIMHERGTPPG